MSFLLAFAGAAGAQADSGQGAAATEPAANAVLLRAPTQIALHIEPPTGGPTSGAATGVATVYRADHSIAVAGTLAPSGADPGIVTLGLPALPKGVYTVVWTTGAGAEGGTFAFAVDPSGASPAAVSAPKAVPTLAPVQAIVVKWIGWVAVMLLAGALALRLLVIAPVVRRITDPDAAAAAGSGTDRRLVRIAAVAAAVLLPATLAQLAYQAGQDHFAVGRVGSALGADFAGTLSLARLVVTGLAVLLLAPVAVRPVRFAAMAGPVMLGGLVLALIELLARAVPSSPPTDVVRSVIGTVMTLAHLFGASIWIGGLVGMVSLAAIAVIPANHRREFWPAAIRRFSLLAMTCVAALTVSGLWLYWVHVDGLGQLASTLYGRTLAVKLILFGGLLALGAFHEVWLMPRVEAFRATGDGPTLTRLVTHHFRAAVAAEVMLGIAVLLIVPMLSGSARNQAFQAGGGDLVRTAKAGTLDVTLKPSGLQPGLTDYTVHVSGDTARQVSLGFAAPDLGVPAHQVLATALGDGNYRVSGYYTPMVGSWQVRVTVDNSPEPAEFTLPVTAKPGKPAKSPPPALTGTTWAYGIGETLALVAVLLGAGWVSRRLSVRRTRDALAARANNASRPQPQPEPALQLSGRHGSGTNG